MALRYGMDLSNYSGVPDLGLLSNLRSQGLDWAILGAQVDVNGNNFTNQQRQACESVGIQVIGVYELLYWDEHDFFRFEHAKGFGLPVCIDCEANASGIPAYVINGIIEGTINQLGAQAAGIYTGRWWWVPYTGDTQQFSYLPLWYADYRNPNFDDFAPFGNWHRPTIWQYSSQCLNPVVCDLNVWDTQASGNGGGNGNIIENMLPVALLGAAGLLYLSQPRIYKQLTVKGNTGPVTITKHLF